MIQLNRLWALALGAATLWGGSLFGRTHHIVVEVRVTDPAGLPVSGATVSLVLPRYAQGKDVVVEAVTNATGVVKVGGEGLFDYMIGVQKAGYYPSTTEKENLVSDQDIARATRHVLHVGVELKPIRNPVGLHQGGSGRMSMQIPTKLEPAAYDLLIGDWVTPWGKGQTADLIFRVTGSYENPRNFDRTLTIEFPGTANGLITLDSPQNFGSELKTPYLAPTTGYVASNLWRFQSTPSMTKVDWSENRLYLFRVRTEFSPDGTIKRAWYGFFTHDVHFAFRLATASVLFNYAINPTGDSNIEMDPKKSVWISRK